jgi:hypothetical protein
MTSPSYFFSRPETLIGEEKDKMVKVSKELAPVYGINHLHSPIYLLIYMTFVIRRLLRIYSRLSSRKNLPYLILGLFFPQKNPGISTRVQSEI